MDIKMYFKYLSIRNLIENLKKRMFNIVIVIKIR